MVWSIEGTGPLATGRELSAEQRRLFLEAFRQAELPTLAPLSQKLTLFSPQEEWKRKVWQEYRAWVGGEPLTRAERGEFHLTEEDRRDMALRVALHHVLEGMGQEALRWVQPEQLALMVLTSVTAYFVLAAIPEPISKGVVLWVTCILVASFGVDLVLHVLEEWRILTAATKKARTFAEIEAAGARFGREMGEDGTRLVLTLVALWVGNGRLTKATPKLGAAPGAEEAARFARQADTLLRKLSPGTAPGVLRATGPRGEATVALETVESLSLRADRVVLAVKTTGAASAVYAARRSHAEAASAVDAPRLGNQDDESQLGEDESPPPAPGSPRPNPATRTAPLVGSQVGAPRSPSAAQKTPIDADQRARIQQALQDCADKAYVDTLRKHLNGRRPTDQECDQLITNARGEQVSLARWLGSEMHDEAQRCAEEVLAKLKPGGFLTNPRYRRGPKDPSKKNPDPSKAEDWRTEWIDPRVEALLAWAEKLGTIVPDIVIHAGHPLLVQAVFDYKFPCKGTAEAEWRRYPPGSPYARRLQNDVYESFLEVKPQLISPMRRP